MRKHILFCLAILFSFAATPLSAQVEIGTNPLGFLFNRPDLSVEYVVSKNYGLELTSNIEFGGALGILNGSFGFDLTRNGYRFRLAGKYYFNEDLGGDRWFAGIYLGPRRLKSTETNFNGSTFKFTERYFALGFNGGFKWVGDNGILFEFSGGAGRAFNNGSDPVRLTFSNLSTTAGIDLYTSFKLGYRF